MPVFFLKDTPTQVWNLRNSQEQWLLFLKICNILLLNKKLCRV